MMIGVKRGKRRIEMEIKISSGLIGVRKGKFRINNGWIERGKGKRELIRRRKRICLIRLINSCKI